VSAATVPAEILNNVFKTVKQNDNGEPIYSIPFCDTCASAWKPGSCGDHVWGVKQVWPIETAVVPEWETPSHVEIDLTTVTEESLDLDPFCNPEDARLCDAIIEAKRKKAAAVVPKPFFQSIALPLAARGLKVGPVNGKRPFLDEHEKEATADARKITETWKSYADCNVGVWCIQEEGGAAIVDVDGQNVLETYTAETGEPAPSTYVVQSSPNKFHIYFWQTDKTRALPKNIIEGMTGGEFSLRVNNYMAVGEGSIHPKHGGIYTAISNAPIIPMPDDFFEWLIGRANKNSSTGDFTKRPDGWIYDPIVHGNINNQLTAIAGYYIQNKNMDDPGMLSTILEKHAENQAVYEDGVTPFECNLEEIRTIAEGAVARWKTGEQRRKDETPLVGGVPAGTAFNARNSIPVIQETEESTVAEDSEDSEIPAFDPSVINGIYAKFVDVITRGTTLAPQFAYVVAKTVVGLKMAGKVAFENLDVEPRFYIALIGATGSGKGEAWRRMDKILRPDGCLQNLAKIKVINSADSGAGLKDYFFEPPENDPVLCFVDEVVSLGNKSADTRNPGILDALIELADSTSVSRVLAKKGRGMGGTKTKNDARLATIMCGQDGTTYTKAFAGRTKLGLWDRFYPEFGVPQESGDMPPIGTADSIKLVDALNSLDYSGTMKMSPDAKSYLDAFWTAQPGDVRKKARWKKNLILDAYMSAFGRGSKVAQLEDAEIAIKIFKRQLVIRQVCFTTEVPDKIGYYIGSIKNIIAKMERQLAAGVPEDKVAKSRRDFETLTHAFRDNEGHLFSRAWDVHSKVYLKEVRIKKSNGQEYVKYLPAPNE
jgi:hypothetical protein